MSKLLVYGSLRSFHPNHRQLRYSGTHLCDVWIRGYDLYQLGTWFPGVIHNPDSGGVFCELYEIDDLREWNYLDQYEGYDKSDEKNSLFVRRLIQLPDNLGEAYIYIWNGVESGTKIETGDFYDFWSVYQAAA